MPPELIVPKIRETLMLIIFGSKSSKIAKSCGNGRIVSYYFCSDCCENVGNGGFNSGKASPNPISFCKMIPFFPPSVIPRVAFFLLLYCHLFPRCSPFFPRQCRLPHIISKFVPTKVSSMGARNSRKVSREHAPLHSSMLRACRCRAWTNEAITVNMHYKLTPRSLCQLDCQRASFSSYGNIILRKSFLGNSVSLHSRRTACSRFPVACYTCCIHP